MEYQDIVSTLATILTVVGLYYVVRQLKLTRLGQEEDHRRRKNEATLDVYNEIRNSMREHDDIVLEYLKIPINEKMSEQHVENILKNKVTRSSLRTTLQYLSRFAVGVKHDIYDLKTLYDLNGYFFILMYERYEKYIKYIQVDHPDFYVETQSFIEMLRVLRNKKDDNM